MKKLNSVKVLFENPEHNYKTSVSAESTEETVKHYFVGKYFDMGRFPNEDFHKCIGIEFIDNNVVSVQQELNNHKSSNNVLDIWLLFWFIIGIFGTGAIIILIIFKYKQ